MSDPRKTLAPPPPRHPAVRPPSPNFLPYPNISSAPPPLHPSHPPLPPRPPPSLRPDIGLEYSGSGPTPSRIQATLDVPGTPHVQASPSLILQDSPVFGDAITPTSSADIRPTGSPPPPPEHSNTSPELLLPVSRKGSFSSITNPATIPPPIHHARKARSFSSDLSFECTLSEEDLRDLYDDEEIDRFLRLFSNVGRSFACFKSTNWLWS